MFTGNYHEDDIISWYSDGINGCASICERQIKKTRKARIFSFSFFKLFGLGLSLVGENFLFISFSKPILEIQEGVVLSSHV